MSWTPEKTWKKKPQDTSEVITRIFRVSNNLGLPEAQLVNFSTKPHQKTEIRDARKLLSVAPKLKPGITAPVKSNARA